MNSEDVLNCLLAARKVLTLTFLGATGFAAEALYSAGHWPIAAALLAPVVFSAVQVSRVMSALASHHRFPVMERSDVREVCDRVAGSKAETRLYSYAVAALNTTICAYMVLGGSTLLYPGIGFGVVFGVAKACTKAIDVLEAQ